MNKELLDSSRYYVIEDMMFHTQVTKEVATAFLSDNDYSLLEAMEKYYEFIFKDEEYE